MRKVELKGIVLKVLKQGTNQTVVLFMDNQAGKIVLSVNRTHKLFYEIKEGMILSTTVSIKGFTDLKRKICNGLNIESYEILNVKGGE
ncbi:TPA: hypothetical protein ACNHTV_001577 [Enterococcus faecalis]|uniref:hypothetical protein n=1 Tax=Enterococcus TaxID=1350 RepID=UPI0006661DE5|nr:hypothetical protein [Enterococcus faecalis]DAW19492.1 MAG TPA: hypothetical protein [Caudoviricetes sp.]EGO2664878.1 hypothetical protein [Enterococcus faecalis]EGO5029867.1 hypothetical protein [Enterococcus faecalis]EGO7769171.1 hypothetical protein [Enterococcus faecalis]EHB6498612.1 hypothetical protein [Enterococcus faecalis]